MYFRLVIADLSIDKQMIDFAFKANYQSLAC